MPEIFHDRRTQVEELYPIYAAQALIFAGGLGSRAEELTHRLEIAVKHLLPTRYTKTLLDHSVAAAQKAGVGKTNLIISNHTASAIVPHARKNYPLYDGLNIFEHSIPTAGVAQVFDLFVRHEKPSGPLIKLEGDELNVGFDLEDMYRVHTMGRHPITYLVTKGNSYRYKLIADDGGMVVEVKTAPFSHSDEKDGYDLSGTFIINPSMVNLFLNSGNTLNFLLQATALRKLFIYHHKKKSININTPADYNKITKGRGY